MGRLRAFYRAPVALLAAAGGLLLFSLILAVLPAGWFQSALTGGPYGGLIAALLLPGRFLLTLFSWAAFYVPVYLFLTALFVNRFAVRRMIVLMLTLLPFLSGALFFTLAFSDPSSSPPVADLIRAVLGPTGGMLFAAGFTIAEIALIAAAARVLGAKRRLAGAVSSSPPHKTGRAVSARRYLLEAPGKNAAGDDGLIEEKTAEETMNAVSGKRAENEGDELFVIDHTDEGDGAFEPDVSDSDAEAGPGTENVVTAAPARTPALHADAGDRDDRPVPASASAPVEKAPIVPGKELPRSGVRKPVRRYRIRPEDVLTDYGRADYNTLDAETRRLSETLKATLEEFKIQAEVTGIQKGPVITMFELLPAHGVKLSRIVNLADNIALRLAASRVRIVAPIPGKQAVGIEVPNKRRAIVSLRETIAAPEFQENDRGLPIALGKDNMGNVIVADLTQMPHLLIAGATGSGKSVCVNSLICSILFKKSPEEARLILIDPKIVELKYYNDIPHLLTPVITEPKKAYQALQYCIAEMERRYALLDALCARDIAGFNAKAAKKTHTAEPLPHIVVVIDEFADLIAVTGKDMESTLARLAAMSRAVGIHIVLATQRPSIDVITGLIKANIPARIAFMVAGKFDSRIIIDQVGAEKLLGQGDMLFLSPQNPFPVRIQGAFISDREVEDLVAEVKSYGEPDYIDDEIFIEEEGDFEIGIGEADPMFDKALEIVLAAGKASTSYVQRKLKIGYNRAARLIEEMEIRGIVGPANGSKARDIIHVPSKVRE